MSTSIATSLGDDPLIPPDVGYDPSALAPDPFSYDSVPTDPGSTGAPIIYGPTLAQLGADKNSAAVIGAPDVAAANSSPTTATKPGTSVLDNILSVGKLGLGITSALENRGSFIGTPVPNANKVATSKSPTTGAGTSISLVVFAILGFLAIVLFLELKH